MTSVGFTKCLLCLCFVSSVLVDGNAFTIGTEESFLNLIRSQRAVKSCNGFTCSTNGKCIPPEKRCDGKEDCPDGSDEFSDCKTAVECPGFLFTCDYGACVEADKECNGVKDCRDNSDESRCPDSNKNDEKVSSNCKSNEFECDSGQCIPKDNKCNGIADCKDKSDETKKTCLNMFCPGFTFTCDYGACVDGYAPCNGINECLDGSDERNCENQPVTVPTVTKKPPVTSIPPGSGCILPNHPENGHWTIAGGAKLKPNTKVGLNTILQFACNSQYTATGQAVSACFESGWSSPPPRCQKLCPPLYTTEVTHVSCQHEKKGEVKCDQATDGTSAKFECAPYYEPADRVTALRFCYDGSWSLPPPQCIPVCGEKRVTAEPLIVNGKNVEKGDYPWVAAIFHNQGGEYINVCGGSVLTQKVIITAAHCVSNVNDGSPMNMDLVRVGVGKYYKNYKDPRDTQAQYSALQKMLVHPKYKGEAQHYASDIAFLVTKDTLLLSKVVQPVCYHNLNSIHINSKTEGVITGWGYTQAGGKPSEELKEVDIPYKDDPTCTAELPPEWSNQYFTIDKFCAGHYNKSIAVCKGDSGGGLVFPNPKDGRYYIHGLVSVGHRVTDGCDVQISALFTKVAFYSDWLEQVTAQYKSNANDVAQVG